MMPCKGRLHGGTLPLKPPWGLAGALLAAGDGAQHSHNTHLPAPICQMKFTPSPRTGLRQQEGARAGTHAVTRGPDPWLLMPVERLQVGFAAPARGPKPSPAGLVTGSAHLSSPATDTGRDDSALSIVICTQNRAEPCLQLARLRSVRVSPLTTPKSAGAEGAMQSGSA